MGSNYDIATIRDSRVNNAVYAKMVQLNVDRSYIGLVKENGKYWLTENITDLFHSKKLMFDQLLVGNCVNYFFST